MRHKLAVVGFTSSLLFVVAGCGQGQTNGNADETLSQQSETSNHVTNTPIPVLTGGVGGQPLPTQRYACDDGTILFIAYENASRLIQFAEINIDGVQYSLPGRSPPKGVNGQAYTTAKGRHGVPMEWWVEADQARLVDVTYANGDGHQGPNYEWTTCWSGLR